MPTRKRVVELTAITGHSTCVVILVISIALLDVQEAYWLYAFAAMAIVTNVAHARLTNTTGIIAITIPCAMLGYILLSNDVAKVAAIRHQQQTMYQTLLESYQYTYTNREKRKALLPYHSILPIIELNANTSNGWVLLTEKNESYRDESLWYLNGGQRTLYLIWLYENLGVTPAQEQCLLQSVGTLERDLIAERTSLNLDQWLKDDTCQMAYLIGQQFPPAASR